MAENIQKILAKKEGLSKNFLLGYLEKQKELFNKYEEELQNDENFYKADTTTLIADQIRLRSWILILQFKRKRMEKFPLKTEYLLLRHIYIQRMYHII